MLSVNYSLKLGLFLDFVDTDVPNPSEAGYTPVWEKKSYQHAHSRGLCAEEKGNRADCNLLEANGVMAGVRASSEGGLGRLPCEDLSARIWGWLVMHLASQSLSLSQFSAPCWQCLSARVTSAEVREPPFTQREVRSEHTSPPGDLI